MDFKIYKAKTVNDAITEALIDLEITSDKIEYEVIEEGSSGLLGLFSKEAMIKAWKKEEIMLEEQEEDYFDIKSQFRTDSAPLLTPQKAKPARKSKNSGASQESRKNHDQAEKPVREEKQPREDRLAREDRPVKEDRPQKQTQKKAAPVSEEKEPVPATLDEPYANPAIENVMQTIFRKLDIDAQITMTINQGERSVNVIVDGADTGEIIGKRGQTLDAIQYLLSIIVNKEKETYYRVKLDTNNYRERRQKTLENLARNVAAKVKKTRRKVVMEPMNPYERRIIHSYLQADKYVTTKSEGVEPNRRVVVYYKKS